MRAPASGSAATRCSSMPSSRESAISRCWAPSCRLRSRRWRSLWPASITRARDPLSSSRRARSSTWRRVFSMAMPAAAVTAARSWGSSPSDGRGRAPRPARAVAVDRGHRPARAGPRQLRHPPVEVGVAAELGQPVGELERGVAQRARERIAQLARARLGVEVDEQVADGRAREAGLEQPEQERDRRQADHEEGRPLDPGEGHLAPGAVAEQEGDHHQGEGERVDEQGDPEAPRPARGPPAEDQDHDPGEHARAERGELDPGDDQPGVRLLRHLQQVVGAVVAERHVDDLEADGADVGDGHDRPSAAPPRRPLG